MDFVKYQIFVDRGRDIVMAYCSELPFSGFEEQDWGFLAYLPTDISSGDVDRQLQQWADQWSFTFSKSLLPNKNWNAAWEASFEPIRIGDFCGVRADFHPPLTGVAHDVVITPKMAFGTGHHQTTYMMIDAMAHLNFNGKKVLDYGCGTGILSILAEQLGAKEVLAIDIDAAACENTLENAAKNRVHRIRCRQGTLELVDPSGQFDIILANINRHVILDSLQSLFHQLNSGGQLLISGFLTRDENLMKAAIDKYGFILACVEQKDNWLCFQLGK